MPAPASKIFLLIVILGLMTINAGCSESTDPLWFYSSSGYKLYIQTDEPLSNVTFYLPLPVKNGKPLLGASELTPSIFKKGNYSVELGALPPEMNIPGVYVLPDNPTLWLKIHTDMIYPNASYVDYSIEVSNRTELNSPLLFSNTVNPLGNQSVFLPKINFSFPAPVRITPTYLYWIEYAPIKIPQQIPLYTEYSASLSAHVEIFSDIGVSNTWKENKFDSNVWNDYDDNFDWHNTGSSHGWQIANGEFTAAEGIYPNLSDPLWQKVLNGTPTGT
jgi:hypothetical protein